MDDQGDSLPRQESGEDLEYDLAHEAGEARPLEQQQPAQPTYVATETDYDGDYGYDLAHDVPRSGRLS